MNELGMIINQNGEYMSFGVWDPQKNDLHAQSFIKDIYNTEWFEQLGIPYNPEKDFHNQLDLFAQYKAIVILNAKEDYDSPTENRFIISSPENFTEEQINTLNSFREKFISFEDGHYSFIDIVSSTGEYLQNFYSIKDYYNYIDEKTKNKLHR